MTISTRVQGQLFEIHSPQLDCNAASNAEALRLIRLAPTSAKEGGVIVATSCSSRVIRTWTRAEHERFLAGLELYPHGPWKQIADHVGTKTTRQTMAHAQKYRQKIARRRQQMQLQQAAQQQQPPCATEPQQYPAPPCYHSTSSTASTEEDNGEDDDEDDNMSVSSEESAATELAVDGRSSDLSGDLFFETEILPLLQQLEPLPTGLLDVKFEDVKPDDVLMVEAPFF